MSASASVKSRGGREKDWRTVVEQLKSHVNSNTVDKLFEKDHQFIFELIKILYEDVLDLQEKMDILMIIEQECSAFINKNSVDQILAALIDIFETEQVSYQTLEIREQLLITITTIFIENDELLEQQLGSTFISKLIELLRKTNNVSNRRLRSMACNCLTQIEEWQPGILWKWKDSLGKMARDERTDVCQDYVYLLITVIKNSLEEESHHDMKDKGILQTVSYTMDNISLLTGPGALSILHSVSVLVQSSVEISPSVFKPFMLHSIPCMDPCILYVMLYIQNKFQGEILSPAEEKILLLKAMGIVNHAAVTSKARLLILQWLISYVQQHESESFLQELLRVSHATIFDPLNIHSCKLLLHCLCTPSWNSKVISKDLHYLNQLALITGGIRVTRALYNSLYSHVCLHNCEEVHSNALSITKNLFQKFPHLIPLIVDFLQTVQVSHSDTNFHVEILSVLHNTVLSVPLSSLLSNYQNYLQVWILSAQDPSMHLQKQLRRMLELAEEANSCAADDWLLGCLLLSICRTMMLHHQTDIFYSQMGDLLFYMMHHFSDPDIQDYARFFYALLTLTSSVKAKEILNAELGDGLKFGENLVNIFPGSMVQVLPSDIRMLDVSPIHCSRKQVSVHFKELNKDSADLNVIKDVTDYLKQHRSGDVHLKPFIKCELTVSVKEEADLHNLIAVTLNISNQQKDILNEEKSTVFYQFCPHKPVPCALSLRSFFSHDKATFQCDLDPIHLNLADFLVPFPWNIFSIDVNRQEMFDSMWSHCTDDKVGDGIESVKIMSCDSQVLASIWKDALVNDESRSSDDDNAKTNANCFLFLMVPSSHLLLRTYPRSADTVVEIVSDFPQVLEDVDEFLENLIGANES